MEKRQWGINGRERASSLNSPCLSCVFTRLYHTKTIRSVVHIDFLYRRSSFTLPTFPRQVHVRRSNVIPLGHRILGHLHRQVLGSRNFTDCLQGFLLQVHLHFSLSNWKRFVHFDSMFVGSHLHWHFTGSQRKLLGQGIGRGLHWQLHSSLEYCCVLLSQSVGFTLHPQEQRVWFVTWTAINLLEISSSSALADDQATLLTTRFRSCFPKENKKKSCNYAPYSSALILTASNQSILTFFLILAKTKFKSKITYLVISVEHYGISRGAYPACGL